MRRINLVIAVLAISLCVVSATSVSAQAPARPGLGNARLRVIGSVPLNGAPVFEQALFANGAVFISHPGDQSIDVFNVARRHIIGHVTGLSNPRGMALDEAAGAIYAADAGHKSIAAFSVRDFKVQKTFQVPFAPQDLALAVAAKTVFASALDLPQVVSVPLDGSQPSTVDLNGRIGGLAFDPSSNRLFATINSENEISVLNTAAGKLDIAQHWKLNASQPTGIAVDSETGRVFVAVRYAVLSVNINTGQEISRVPTAAGTDVLLFEPKQKVLYAGSTDGTVSVIDASKSVLVTSDEIRTGVKGHSFAVDPKTNILYMPGGQEGRAKLAVLKPYTMRLDTSADEDDDQPAAAKSTPATTPR